MKITAYIKHTAVAALVVTIFAACSTDENFYYQDTPRVRLVGPETWAVGTDSILFSFVTYPQETKEMVFDVKAQIMGQPSQQARTATIAIDNSKTTASESMYSVPATVTIAAGETSATFPVTVKRDASLTTKQVRLYIKVTESSDFKVGVNEENHLSIIWSDVLSRPNNWDALEKFFGAYSDTKYRFMLEHIDTGDVLDADKMSWAKLNSYKIRFINALDEYNAAHPGAPLTDENGVLVTF